MNKTLSILLLGKDQASGPIKKVRGELGTLDSVAKRLNTGVRTIGSNLAAIGKGAAIVGIGAGVLAIKSGLSSLAELENVTSATQAAIAATGGKAKVSAAQIRDWSQALESATGAAVDDKAIQAGATNLLRFTNIQGATFRRTLTAAVDLGAAMKSGPEEAANLLGKALSDPLKGMAKLAKAGVVLSDADKKRVTDLMKLNKVSEAQAVILGAIEGQYKGAAKASVGPYQRSINLLKDAYEDATMALATGFLPVLERAATWINDELAKPSTMAQLRTFGQSLANMFDKGLTFAQQIPWSAIGESMALAGQGAKAAWDLFNGMPDWVKTAVLTGWGLNKLSGGMVTGIIGELGKGLIKGVLGMNAGVVNINAGVVNSGGIPGVAGGAAAGAAGSAALIIPAVAVGAAALALIYQQGQADHDAGRTAAHYYTTATGQLAYGWSPADAEAQRLRSIRNPGSTANDPMSIANGLGRFGSRFDRLDTTVSTLRSTFDRGGRDIAAAIRAAAPSVTTTVTVNVTASGIQKTVTVASRYGRTVGSAYGGPQLGMS